MIAVVSVNGYCVFIGVVFDIRGPILLVAAYAWQLRFICSRHLSLEFDWLSSIPKMIT